MIRFPLLLDQGVPVDAVGMFRKLGYRATHLSELGMKSHSDAEIIKVAVERHSAILTLDADFHALIAVQRLARPSVIRLRVAGCRAEAFVEILEPVLERFDSEILNGALISVRGTRVTCRLLPVTRAIF